MKIDKINKELKPFLEDQITANNWYESKAIEVITKELYEYLQEFNVFNASYHYHVTFDGWTHYRTYSDCQMSAGELIEMLIELHIEHGNHWAFYIENAMGDPKMFIEYSGYEFYFDMIEDY